jgi:hypothetical protein
MTPETIKIATTREGRNILLWIAAESEKAANDHAKALALWPSKSRWAGSGHYRNNVYIVTARSAVPR